MANHDLSRYLLRNANHYSGLRMQQGRAMLDSDFSEAEMLDDEDQRRMAVDVIGPHGSPDDGFTIVGASTGSYGFYIVPGSYYLGGMRHELVSPAPTATAATTGTTATAASNVWFLAQNDWKQFLRPGGLPAIPAVPTASRQDLVYLVGWEQEVSAVEDRQFQELALGGPDTSARVRRMHRVYVKADVPADCDDAFAALTNELIFDKHVFDSANHELKSGARLTVVMDQLVKGDVCKPDLPPGYTGVEDQAIRVQLIAPTTFLWAFDNAAPLYRVTTSKESEDTVISFLTLPRDQAHFPGVGQVLEILPWGAELHDGEYAADLPIAGNIGGGVLARVTAPYDPATGTVKVKVQAPATLATMTSWFPNVPPQDRFFYLRVWNPGDGAATGSPGVVFKPGVLVTLPGTGIQLRFKQEGIVGDYWILAARPAAPTQVVPWTLKSEEAPHGPRRFYCPLALLHWSVPAGAVRTVAIDSCRRTFRPLTQQKGCCTVTVGDDNKSYGDYTSINAALAAIPEDQPGKICILPGVYKERVVIRNRRDLVIEGCGGDSVIRTPTVDPTSEGLITISSSTNITVKDLKIEANGQFGVMVYQAGTSGGARSREIDLVGLDVTTTGAAPAPEPALTALWIPIGPSAFPLCTIAASYVEGLRIHDCKLRLVGTLSGAPNTSIVDCQRVSVRDCRIVSPSPDTVNISKAWGGLHLGGACRDVAVESCEIEYGVGCGITFGTASVPSASFGHRSTFDPVGRFVLTLDGTTLGSKAELPGFALPPGGGAAAAVTLSGELVDVRIRNNRIRYMGSSAISVLGFWPDSSGPYEAVATHDTVIADNVLTNNYQAPGSGAAGTTYIEYVAFGGIVLGYADGLRIHNNRIVANGLSHLRPTCGIYVLQGEDILVEDNKISGNGARVTGSINDGIRAGIALQLAARRVTGLNDDDEARGDMLLPAARVRGNLVSQPAGRALQLYGLGPMFIEGNVLVSEGRGYTRTSLSGPLGECVDIQNLGQSPELVARGWIPADMGFFPATAMTLDPGDLEVTEALVDGRTLFTDNQVRFNPVDGEDVFIECANRLHSYGDVAVLDNQFFVKFQVTGDMAVDTRVVAWSTRTSNNRWEDPVSAAPTIVTDVSAWTLAVMNITTLNQATRCIHVDISGDAPPITGNPIEDDNQTYHQCTGGTELSLLLAPPKL